MKLLVPFDALVFQLKNTTVLMGCLVSETEDVILHSLRAFEENEPSMHVIEVDEGPDTEYYSYKQYASYSFEDVVDTYTVSLPSCFRRSSFLTIYSMLEFHLTNFCNKKMDAMRFPLSYKDINGTGIERCNTILKKIFGMVHSENMKLLNQLTRLRNACIHNNAIITNDKDKLNSLTSLSNGTLYFQNDEVIFLKGSLDFIISIIKEHFENIELLFSSSKR